MKGGGSLGVVVVSGGKLGWGWGVGKWVGG